MTRVEASERTTSIVPAGAAPLLELSRGFLVGLPQILLSLARARFEILRGGGRGTLAPIPLLLSCLALGFERGDLRVDVGLGRGLGLRRPRLQSVDIPLPLGLLRLP